jgi:hypothetical protein
MKHRLCTGMLLLLNACAPSVNEELLTSTAYPPTSQIDLLDTWPTDKRFVEIGTATTDASQKALAILMDRGMRIGANAVVLGRPQRREAMVPIGSSNAGSRLTAEPYMIPLVRVRAVYLKYLP